MNFKEEFNIAGFFYILSAIYWISIGIMAAYWTLYLVDLGISFAKIALITAMIPI